ncbi:MAG: phosphate/phosphite/phosphonate ABC transporter substrate-binding protein [Chloroflexi bacterium]|nr:phosphate/phosphite/phosphonate ABC transporter substrate-binding protein [Chloroflexota bacterium]
MTKPPRTYRVLLILALLAIISVLAGSGCGGDTYTRVNLQKKYPREPVSGLTGAAITTGQPALRVGIAGVISPAMTLESYQQLLQYMGKTLGRPVQLVQRPTYSEMNELIKNRQVEVAFVCSLAYVEGKSDFDMELLAAPQVRGAITYNSYLIVPADSTAAQLEDLRGKVFAFTDPLSNSGRLAPTYELARIREKPETFFRNYIFTYNHDYSIQAVADRLVDGAAVDSLIYDYLASVNSPLIRKTKVIASWGPYGIPPVVVHPGLDISLKTELKEFFLSLHTEAEGLNILDSLLIDRFVEVSDGIFDSLRQMKQRLAGAQ